MIAAGALLFNAMLGEEIEGGVSLRLLPSRGVPLLLSSFPFSFFVGVLNVRVWSSAFQRSAARDK